MIGRVLRRPRLRFVAAAAVLATATTAFAPLGADAVQGSASVSASGSGDQVRVDQVGYLPTDVKHAYLMATAPVAHATWRVIDSHGVAAASGTVGTSNRGAWNAGYPDVYDITFTALSAPGRYHLEVQGGARATSPLFAIEDAASLYGTIVTNGVSFYQTQRDGSAVLPGQLDRQPSHLTDSHANVYAIPSFDPDTDGETNVGPLVLQGLCATATGTANRSRVALKTCAGTSEQEWTINSDGSIVVTASGKCLSVVGGATANGSPADVFDCDGSDSQLWSALARGTASSGRFQGQVSNKCLSDSGNALQIAACSNSSANEQVHFSTGLTKIGGPVDAEGGWFDAGDFLKFTHTAAYGDVLLYASARGLGATAPASLKAEAQYGEQWLNKMWDQKTKTLYLQVGIGVGDDAGTYFGDHDIWRLPQADTTDHSTIDLYAAQQRPVFEAAAPGQPISPNLAGRVAAAFALAAQSDAHANHSRALSELQAATSVYALANTTHPPDPLTTAEPNDFYPESSWHDDMELGAAEISLALQSLGRTPATYLAAAAHWAQAYIADDAGSDTFNLYDTSALAHADLVQAMDAAGDPSLAVTRTALITDLKRQVQAGATHATSDVFRAAGDIDNFDVDSHTFGWIATEAWYAGLANDHSYDAFAAEQRDWLFGANAWGTSFMVGEGDTFPNCMQHQVANLSGSTNGTPPVAVGAVVNGPNDAGLFDPSEGGIGGYQDGMVPCPPDGSDPYAAFDGHGSTFIDDVRSWQTDEPALDMTGAAIIAAASQLALDRDAKRS
jgi:Glycosyl hydrolase family 9/Cellulase N-terminal ig-like domain/Ricin-type beta-trefoil lectin domain